MQRVIKVEVRAAPGATLAALADLSTYPHWLPLVTEARPDSDETWVITLRAKLGPLARSKQLRMRRTEMTENHVRFERQEVDGREHATWTLDAAVNQDSSSRDRKLTTVVMTLHYDGSLWSAPLEAALAASEGTAAKNFDRWLHG